MSDNQIVINLEHVNSLAKEGGKLIFKKQAEEAIFRLLQMKDFIEEKIEEVKLSIVKSGKYLDPEFKGVVGECVKAMYRYYGKKYTYTGDPERVPPEVLPFVKLTVHVEVDSKAVDKHLKETGNLPGMIAMNERKPVLSLSKLDVAEDFNSAKITPEEPKAVTAVVDDIVNF